MATQRDRYHEGLGRADRLLFYVYYIVFKQFLSFAAGEDGVPPMVRMGIGPCRQVAHRDAQHRGDVGERRVGGEAILFIEHLVGGEAEPDRDAEAAPATGGVDAGQGRRAGGGGSGRPWWGERGGK